MNNKKTQNQIDKILFNLEESDANYFFKMCRFNANYCELQEWLLKKSGEKVPLSRISNWFKYNRPTGTQAIILNEIMEQYENINPHSLLNISAGITANLIVRLNELVQIELDKASTATKLTNLVELLKELRQISNDLKQTSQLNDVDEIYKSGMIALANELIILFKKSPNYRQISVAINASIKKLTK